MLPPRVTLIAGLLAGSLAADPGFAAVIEVPAGDPGKAELKIKGKGSSLVLWPLEFGVGTHLVGQIRSTAGGCYGSVFSHPYRRDDTGQFKDTSD